MLCKAAHETQNNVDEKTKNQYLAGEKTRSLQWLHNLFFLTAHGGNDDYIRLKEGAMQIVKSFYGFGPNTAFEEMHSKDMKC